MAPQKATRPAADLANGPCAIVPAWTAERRAAYSDPEFLQVAPIRVDVKLTASGRKWRASFDGKVLCTSTSPLVIAARVLIANGHDLHAIIEMFHRHVDTWALRGQLGAIAAIVLDGEKTLERPAKNGVPVRQMAGEAL